MARTIDHGSDRPAYRQIADHLRAAILSGELPPGKQLPSERALMESYGAARGTVRQAIATLRAEGLIDIEHGRGAFARRRPPVRRLAYDRFARRHREAGKAAYLIGNGRRLVADGRSGPTGIGGSSVELPSSVGQRGRACNATDGADASLVGNTCIVVMPPRHRRLSLRRSPTTHQQRLLRPSPTFQPPEVAAPDSSTASNRPVSSRYGQFTTSWPALFASFPEGGEGGCLVCPNRRRGDRQVATQSEG